MLRVLLPHTHSLHHVPMQSDAAPEDIRDPLPVQLFLSIHTGVVDIPHHSPVLEGRFPGHLACQHR